MKESRYTSSFDGTPIAYRIYGEGDPAIVLSNGIGCNQVFFKYLIRDLAPRYRVVVWDYRGHVDSGIGSDRRLLTIPCCARDLAAVMDAAEVERAVLGGFSMGVQVSLEMYAQCPDRALGLLALCGPYENPIKTFFYLGPLMDLLYPALVKGARLSPELVGRLWRRTLNGPWVFPSGRLFVFNEHLRRSDFESYMSHLADRDITTLLQMGAYLGEHSAAHILPRVAVPTLVVAGTRDNFTPLKVCRHIAETIPRAEWYPVEGGTHGTLIEHPRQVGKRVQLFMSVHFP